MAAERHPHPRVLIVEDDAAMLGLIDRFLRRQGYDTTTASDSQAALAAIGRQPPTLAIIDYMLPGPLNGLELLLRLRERYPELRTLFISAFGSPELCRQARSGGATDCLIKPFEMTTLVERVEVLLTGAGRDGEGESPPPPERSAG
jgi:DNA-binding response OmpR family regulator